MDKIEKVLGPDARHPRARRRHQRADDGLDDGRVRQAPRPHAGVVTGKPIALEGSYGREAATGRGCVFMFREAAPELGLDPGGHDLRRPGLRQRRLLGRADHPASSGAKMVGVADADGAIRSRRRHRRRRARRARRARAASSPTSTGAEAIDPDELLAIRVRRLHPGGARRHDPRGQRRPAATASMISRAPTARPRRPPTRSSPTRASTSSPTCSPTPAASSSPTSSGSRTSSTSAGRSARSTTGSATIMRRAFGEVAERAQGGRRHAAARRRLRDRHRARRRGRPHPRLHLVPTSTPADTCRAGRNRYEDVPPCREMEYDGMEGSVELSGTGRR